MEVDGTGAPRGGLAESWSTSEDGLTWRFVLRKGAVFHDGTPLTAEAVVNSLKIAQGKPGVVSRAPVADMRAEGGEVVIALNEPFAPLAAFLAHSSTQILAPASYGADGTAVAVIGTGPYRIVSLEPPQKMTIARFDGYWGEKPAIAEAVYLAAGRGETRALMAESGDAHIVFNLDPASVARLKTRDGLDVRSVAIPRVVNVKVNAGHPLLADAQVREALSLAIDRKGIAQGILRQPDMAADQIFPPGMGPWHFDDVPALGLDLDKARALLAGAGFVKGEDGMLSRDGAPFAVRLLTYSDRPELPLIATAMQSQLKAVGIAAEVVIGNSSEVPSSHQNGTLELALVARNFSLVPDPIGTLMQDFGPAGGDWGAMNWANEDVVAAIARLAKGENEADAASDRKLIVSTLQAELPVIPVVWYQQTAAISTRLNGVEIDPFERTYGISAMSWAN